VAVFTRRSAAVLSFGTDMMLEGLIATYGYVAIVIGSFLEGETILVLGGVAAYKEYLDLFWVIAAAFAGSLFGDQLFFFFGRRYSERILRRWPAWRPRVDRGRRQLDRFKTPLILVFRFLYGLRIVVPFVIGMSSVSTARFAVLNAAGAIIWAVSVGAAGYLFGNALEIFIGDLRRHEMAFFISIAAIGAILWLIHFLRGRRKGKRPARTPEAPA
jgi:membrane protein DedA with SNARE-associated domain